MARKPNYRFERLERERKKAAKKAAKLEAKREAKAGNAPADAEIEGMGRPPSGKDSVWPGEEPDKTSSED